MDLNKSPDHPWKTITILLFIAAGLVFVCSLPSYQAVIAFLGRLQPDGSFDSLSTQSYSILQWLIRGKALILAAAGAFCLIDKDRSSRWIRKIGNKLSRISVRLELKAIFTLHVYTGR